MAVSSAGLVWSYRGNMLYVAAPPVRQPYFRPPVFILSGVILDRRDGGLAWSLPEGAL